MLYRLSYPAACFPPFYLFPAPLSIPPPGKIHAHEAAAVRPVGLKSAMTFQRNLVRNLETFAREEPAAAPTLLYDGSPIPSFGSRKVSVLNFRDWT